MFHVYHDDPQQLQFFEQLFIYRSKFYLFEKTLEKWIDINSLIWKGVNAI